jgi:hypothetical protein
MELLGLLASRLARLPVDSRYARKASGLRGSVFKVLDGSSTSRVSTKEIDALIESCFEILSKAAHDLLE